MRSLVKIKPLQNGKITLSFTDVGKSCPSRKFSMWQICLLRLFAKIKFSQSFPILQYLSGALLKAMDINTIIKAIGGTNSQANNGTKQTLTLCVLGNF